MALKVGELFASFDLDSSGMNATMRTIENSMEAMGANMVSLTSSKPRPTPNSMPAISRR